MDLPHLNIPGFTFIEQIGRGGMGTVYIAEQESPRRTVAVKVLDRVPSAEMLARFRREAELVASLEHPRIVPLYAYGQTAGIPFLAMRYLRGGTLADRIRRGPMSSAAAERWLIAIASALDYSHERGIVHRDVKPSNVLLDEEGNAYLSDYGIAGTVATSSSTLPSGSAAYMSPEQGYGEGIEKHTDTYSLAVSLFEALAGQQPYTAETALGVVARHMHDPIPSAHDVNPYVPPGVSEAIERGMAKDPADRPQSAGAFARSVVEAPPDLPEPVEEPARRSWWIPAAVGVAALAALAIGVGAWLGGRSAAGRQADEIAAATAVPLVAEPTVEPGLILEDDFSDPLSGFAVLSDQDGGVAYVEGALEFQVLTDGVRWYSPSARVEAKDVVVRTLAKLVAGPETSELALICRWTGLEGFTALGVRADGGAAVWQVRNGQTSVLKDWTEGFSGFADTPIELTATCVGNSLRLEAMGQLVIEAIDPAPVAGDVALMAGLGGPGEVLASYDDLVAREP